uniref:Alpha N-terminal protein methyltransferase 1 n=1 Tax=Panstrongylus megistus TaxID=65343 RepID=A0A069DQY0_9HEMI
MGTVVDEEMKDTKEDDFFYENAKIYWSKIPATVDGVLGGFGYISKCDLESSEQFLQSLLITANAPGGERALDCGAGIGRITKHLLMKFFKTVDLVEQNKEFLNKAHHFISSSKKLGKLYCTGLQSFIPEYKYDVIWCQWVLGHLTNEDLVKFLKICRVSLAENGLIVVKENITSSGETEKDTVDSSLTRGLNTLLELFEQSNLKIEKLESQTKFPKGLYPVKMIALRPKSD